MPSKPTRRLRSPPVTFSRFARLVALASVYKVKHNSRYSKTSRNVPTVSHGTEVVKVTKKNKNEQQSESSDDEEFENYLDDKYWDLSGFTDLIVGQTTVGTVVKIEEDEDNGVYAVATVLNLGRYKEHKCIMDLKQFLLEVCREKSIKQNMKSILEEQAHDVGLLICQRVLNPPPQLLPPLYDALFDEVSWATEDEPTKEMRNSFRFNYCLLVGKIYQHENINNKQSRTSSSTEEYIIYVKPEDEIFHKHWSWSFSFPLRIQQHSAHEATVANFDSRIMTITEGPVFVFNLSFSFFLNWKKNI